MTVQPVAPLQYNGRYTLHLSAGIVDLDDGSNGTPAQKPLAAYSTSFTTFGPEAIGGTPETYTTGGFTVVGDRAYLAENQGRFGKLRVFDVSDPVQPLEIVGPDTESFQLHRPPPVHLMGNPSDMAVDPESPVTGGRLLAVATNPFTPPYFPAVVRLYDATDDQQFHWIGAVTLGTSPTDGMIRRLRLRGEVLYALTAGIGKGLQVVDLNQAREVFEAATAGGEGTQQFHDMLLDLGIEGRSFAQQAIVQTVFLDSDVGQMSLMTDLQVLDLAVDGLTQPIALVTGRRPLAIANPQTGAVLFSGQLIQGSTTLTSFGYAIGAALVNNTPLAFVSALPAAGASGSHRFVVVSVVDPRAPQVRGYVDLPGSASGAQEIVLRGTTAYVGTDRGTYLVDVSDPAHPRLMGTIAGVGGRLSFTDDGLLYGSVRNPGVQQHELGGVRSAVLEQVTVITKVTEAPAIVALNGRSIEPQRLEFSVVPPDDSLTEGEVELVRGGAVIDRRTVSLSAGRGTTTFDAGLLLAPDTLFARLVVDADEEVDPTPLPRALRAAAFTISPDEPLFVATDEEPLPVGAVNSALLDRLKRDPAARAPILEWRLAGGPGGSLTPRFDTPGTGLYVSDVTPSRAAGAAQWVELLSGGNVLARTDAIQVLPGAAAVATLSVSAANVPADDTSWITVAAEGVRDAFGNPVADGTEVEWTIAAGEGGVFEHAVTLTVGGRAVNRYRAGTEPGPVTIQAEVDDYAVAGMITQARLVVTVTVTDNDLHAEVTSAAGPPADGTPIFFGTALGRVLSESTLTEGRADAEYTAPVQRVGLPKFRWALVFATVGRSRGDVRFEIQRPVTGNVPRVVVDDERLTGNTAAPATPPAPFPAGTMARVTGEPGQTVPLRIGTLRNPNVEPIAAFPFDIIAGGTAEDIFGGTIATVDPGVEVDVATPLAGAGVYRFTGSGGVSVANGPLLNADAFGVNGWVRFESLAPGQTIVQKAGSYGLEVVERSGAVRLAFFVMTGGVRQEVLSPQAIAAATWYHVAAHFRDGRLELSVTASDEGDVVRVASATGPVDATSAPLLLGPSLVGQLDDVALFDFTRPALVTFDDGSVETAVTLDASGEAVIELVSSGELGAQGTPSPDPQAVVATERFDAFARSLRTTALQVYEAPDPTSGDRVEQAQAPIVLEALTQSTRECFAAIAAGESETWGQTGCDIFAGLIPGVGGYQQARDSFKAARHFIDGKATLADYLVAGVTLGTIVAAAIPGVRAAVRAIRGADDVVPTPGLRRVLWTEGYDLVATHLDEGAAVELPELVSLLAADGDTAFKAAFVELAPHFKSNKKAWDALITVAGKNGKQDLAELLPILHGISRDPRFSTEVALVALDGLARANVAAKVRPSAVVGLAVFAKAAPNIPVKRIATTYDHLKSALPDSATATARFDQMFTQIAEGSANGIVGLDRFLAKGPGSRFNATAGFSHPLEYLSEVEQWRDIAGLEVKNGGRTIDVLKVGGGKEEFKNLMPGARFSPSFGGQVIKDIRSIVDESADVDDLIVRLGLLHYIFRGRAEDNVALTNRLREEIAKALGPQHAALASKVKITFLNKNVPF